MVSSPSTSVSWSGVTVITSELAPAGIVGAAGTGTRSTFFTAVPVIVHVTWSAEVVGPVRLSVTDPVVRPASVAVGSLATIVTTGNAVSLSAIVTVALAGEPI